MFNERINSTEEAIPTVEYQLENKVVGKFVPTFAPDQIQVKIGKKYVHITYRDRVYKILPKNVPASLGMPLASKATLLSEWAEFIERMDKL